MLVIWTGSLRMRRLMKSVRRFIRRLFCRHRVNVIKTGMDVDVSFCEKCGKVWVKR